MKFQRLLVWQHQLLEGPLWVGLWLLLTTSSHTRTNIEFAVSQRCFLQANVLNRGEGSFFCSYAAELFWWSAHFRLTTHVIHIYGGPYSSALFL